MSSQQRVKIVWTTTAKEGLKKLPKEAQRGLLDAAESLFDADDPRTQFKSLTGPMKGFNHIRYSRYRAIFTTTQRKLPTGTSQATYTVYFIAAGKREAKSRKDVYAVAERLVRLGLVEFDESVTG